MKFNIKKKFLKGQEKRSGRRDREGVRERERLSIKFHRLEMQNAKVLPY